MLFRSQKPFAIMVRDVEAARRYGDPNECELRAMTSPHSPIVLVDKKNVPESVAPGLDNIGMFLPYTGMQHLLFDHLDADALIMTSANPPGEPMMTSDHEVMEILFGYMLIRSRIRREKKYCQSCLLN